MLEAYDPKPEKYALDSLAEEYLDTLLDPSFQRRGGIEQGSGWSLEQSEFYMGSFLAGRTCNIIVRADVNECLRFAREIGDKDSEAYFLKAQKAGKKFINIDGHNTSSSIYNFLRKKMKLCEPGTRVTKTLDDFDRHQQKDILYKEKITVVTLRRISYRDMCHLFRHLNMSEKLNKQEHRQAMPTLLSAFIRDIANVGKEENELSII